ncbi:MAG: cation-translocating P-type ATPase [Roseinatronobacter sp.]
MTEPTFHDQPAQAVLAHLNSAPDGLTTPEAQARLAQYGPNRLPEPPRPGAPRRFLAQFNNLLIQVLIVAAIVTALLGHWIDTGVIAAVVILNAVIGFVQEGRAEAALSALRDMLAPRAFVLRRGARLTLPADDLVPGDIVLVEPGDRVPADLRLIAAHGLRAEEALLTGESVPVDKSTDPVAADAPLGDRRSMLFSGTLVAAGAGTGVVVATGAQTQVGRIGTLLAGVETLTTPLVVQMDRFARVMTGFVLAASALVLAFVLVVRDMDFAEGFMIVVGLLVAAIPEGLPAVLTVTLAIGVQSMARRNAIIRRLPAIETLGAVSVICSDKTGTLTRNEMLVATLALPGGTHEVTGEGYAPAGTIAGSPDAQALGAVARIARDCTTSALVQTASGWQVEGDPMEGALLALSGKLGLDPLAKDAPETMIPFDARTRYMAVRMADGLVLVKGAPEAVLPRVSATLAGAFDPAEWSARADTIAAQGQRVLALAQVQGQGGGLAPDDLDTGLTLVALVGLIDPPRPEAIAAVADCLRAGITVKMITGDHKGTAAAIGAQIGLARTDTVLTGADVDRLDDAALVQAAADCDIFARTSPEHKLRLVTALQARGAVVAMTGDGVNDAPALKRADAGIAMGKSGSAAAREASDLVLTDDNFASIAEAVRQGRTVYANLRKVIAFLLPVNGGESMALVFAVLLGLVLPITPLQILWVNMVSSVVLAMALAFEPPEPGIMRRPPRRPGAPVLSRFILWRVLLVSLLFSLGVFGQFALAKAMGADLVTARTMALNTLVAMEVFYLFSIRFSLGGTITLRGIKGTPAVLIAVAVVTLLQAMLTYTPVMQGLFETSALSFGQLALCMAAGGALLLVLEFDKRAASFRRSR